MLNDNRKKIVYKALSYTFGILFFSLLFSVLLVNWNKTDLDKGYVEIVNQVQEMSLFNSFYSVYDAKQEMSCDLMNKMLKSSSNEVYELGKKVNLYYEKNNGSYDAKVFQRQFVNANLDLWLKMLEYNENCDFNRNYILYFYPYDCKNCGPLVDGIRDKKNELNDNLWVFSIPAQLDSRITEVLMHNYDVNYIPSIVVNGVTIKGPDAYKEIDKYLN